MAYPNQVRLASRQGRLALRLVRLTPRVCRPGACVLGCLLFAAGGDAAWAQAGAEVQAQSQAQPQRESQAATAPEETDKQTNAAPPTTSRIVQNAPGRRQSREAENAYLAGAKRLERDDLDGAEREFSRALQLDPANRDYALAISVAREHRLTELVQKASKARAAGDAAQAETLLAEARAIDPSNQIVIEHSGAQLLNLTGAPLALGTAQRAGDNPGLPANPLTDRARLLSAGEIRQPWQISAPVFAGTRQLRPSAAKKSFHLREAPEALVREVGAAYGILPVFNEPIEPATLRFDLEDVTYAQAMPVLMRMLHVFAVTIDEHSVLLAHDDQENRQRLQRQMEETIFLSGMTVEQIQEVGNVIRNVFGVTKTVVQQGLQSVIVLAPEEVLGPMNRTLADLIDGNGEVVIEVKLYEIDTTRTRNIGAIIPSQGGIYNVEAAATALVNANQTLVQQAIAQGFVKATASNIDIALALIGSGLVQSSLLSSTVGFFGHGLTQTGVTSSTKVGFQLKLNSSDSRTLDDVQMRVGDHQPATFRAGTRYPVTTATYTTASPTLPAGLANATLNGVSVSSLLAQLTGGGIASTIPQVSYEDLGVTLKATPAIQKSGLVNLNIDMKIQALAGTSLDGIPVLVSRQFTSDITVADGESVILASNMNRTESAAVTGIPGLSELPGFQAPVDRDAEKDTGQLVVLVTPHVVRKRSNMTAGPRMLVQSPGAGPGN